MLWAYLEPSSTVVSVQDLHDTTDESSSRLVAEFYWKKILQILSFCWI
jgi:hypothetical protein